jgi:small subunit ribosomal protein S2
MALPDVTMRQLLEAGVHFGHQTHRWNPKMAPYIYGSRNNIHIIDLTQTVPLLHQALLAIADTVGTKRQASETIADAARSCAQYYVNHRWLGGTLTNWRTISNSIRRLKSLEELLAGETQGLTKKELLQLTREKEKLERSLGGIKDMGAPPDLMFVIDTNKESIAIAEARKLGMPVVAVVDSNCDPEGISHPIPGNDDAGRAITLYCDLIARAAIDGIERAQGAAGVDLGAAEEPVAEPGLEDEGAGGEGGEHAQPERKRSKTARGAANGKAKPQAKRSPKTSEEPTSEEPKVEEQKSEELVEDNS